MPASRSLKPPAARPFFGTDCEPLLRAAGDEPDFKMTSVVFALIAALGSIALTGHLVACGGSEPQVGCKDHRVLEKTKVQPSSSLKALSSPAACVANPCDPFCQNFDEKPDGGVQADAQAGYQWPDWAVSMICRGGWSTKGLQRAPARPAPTANSIATAKNRRPGRPAITQSARPGQASRPAVIAA